MLLVSFVLECELIFSLKKYHLSINYPVSNTVHTFMPVCCQYSLTSFVLLHIWSHYVGVFRVCVYCLGSRYILQFSGLCIWLLLTRYKLKDCTANIYDRITIKLQPFPGLFFPPKDTDSEYWYFSFFRILILILMQYFSDWVLILILQYLKFVLDTEY